MTWLDEVPSVDATTYVGLDRYGRPYYLDDVMTCRIEKTIALAEGLSNKLSVAAKELNAYGESEGRDSDASEGA